MITPPWASYQIRKIAGWACAGNVGNIFPATDFKGNRSIATPTCTTARASRTFRDACRDNLLAMAGKTFPAFPAHAQPSIERFWQETHIRCVSYMSSQWGTTILAENLGHCYSSFIGTHYCDDICIKCTHGYLKNV